jgi:hypothetical protein
MKVKPQPCSFPGYRSGMGLVKSGLAGGMPCRPKFGNSLIWFSNMASTVSLRRICAPVIGDVPSFRSVARISRCTCQSLAVFYHNLPRVCWNLVLRQYSRGFAKQPAPPEFTHRLMSVGSVTTKGRCKRWSRGWSWPSGVRAFM